MSFSIFAFGVATIIAALLTSPDTVCRLVAIKECRVTPLHHREVTVFDIRQWSLVFGTINVLVGMLWFFETFTVNWVPHAFIVLSLVLLSCVNAVWAIYSFSFYKLSYQSHECARESRILYYIGMLTVPVFSLILSKYWSMKANYIS